MKIIRDTREKPGNGWQFDIFDCDLVIAKLDTGDYSLQGHENKICIERKKTSKEIANNLRKDKRDAFFRELDRMKDFDEAYFICEFTIDTLLEYPINSGIPQKSWYKYKNGRRVKNVRMSGKYLYSVLKKKEAECGFKLIFRNGPEAAEQECYEILRNYEFKIKRQKSK